MAGTVLAQTFMAYREPLLRYLRARGAREDAEDLLQELWIKAQSGDDGAVTDTRAYLYRMAHNLMLDVRRTAYRRQHREDAYMSDVLDRDADDIPAAERMLLAKEQLRGIDRMLAGLGQKTDYIFRRHRIDEVRQKDIAVELGITLSAVEKHLQKAYRAVAAAQMAAVEEDGPTPAKGEPTR